MFYCFNYSFFYTYFFGDHFSILRAFAILGKTVNCSLPLNLIFPYSGFPFFDIFMYHRDYLLFFVGFP